MKNIFKIFMAVILITFVAFAVTVVYRINKISDEIASDMIRTEIIKAQHKELLEYESSITNDSIK